MSNWPPDYTKVFSDKCRRLEDHRKDPALGLLARNYYKQNPKAFINDWCMTYDPRNALQSKPSTLPMITFPRQNELIDFLLHCLNEQENGMIEKCRDYGATWLCVDFSVWLFLFIDGASVGWGSRKEQLVDKLGDPDSIFEKIRITLNYLPDFLLPKGFDQTKHCSYMRIINPENGNTITGEGGDNIGRGGRKLIYFKDESAFFERPEKIQAALEDNTNCQIDISTVNGPNNVFHRRRMAGEIWQKDKQIRKGVTRILILDWRDHPMKTQEWYNQRREQADREGLLHLFGQEVDRNYNASRERILIPEEWVNASIDAHKVLNFDPHGEKISGLDVADEGGDKNALAFRNGVLLDEVIDWAMSEDVGATTRKAIILMKQKGYINLQYDAIGVGSGVKAESNRLRSDGKIDGSWAVIPWIASASPLMPNGRVIPKDKNTPINKDFYANLTAQAGWQLRLRFEKTYKMVVKGEKFDYSELISINSKMSNLQELRQELSQPTWKANNHGKVIIDKKPEGTKSPNLFDAVKQAFWPITKSKVLI